MRLLIILAIGFAVYAAFGQGQTTSIRPDGLGEYNVYSGNKQSAHVQPNPIMGGYDIRHSRPAFTPEPLRLAPTPIVAPAPSPMSVRHPYTPMDLSVPVRPFVSGPRFEISIQPVAVPIEWKMDERRLEAAKAKGEARAKEIIARHELVEIPESELLKPTKKATE